MCMARSLWHANRYSDDVDVFVVEEASLTTSYDLVKWTCSSSPMKVPTLSQYWSPCHTIHFAFDHRFHVHSHFPLLRIKWKHWHVWRHLWRDQCFLIQCFLTVLLHYHTRSLRELANCRHSQYYAPSIRACAVICLSSNRGIIIEMLLTFGRCLWYKIKLCAQ